MNAYYESNGAFNSNSRIFEGYFTESETHTDRLQRTWKKLFSRMAGLARALTDSRVCRIAKAISVAVSLVGFVGVIGAMERGGLGIGAGLLIGAALVGLEYLCLRGRRQKAED